MTCSKQGERRVNVLPGMNAGASTYAVPSPIKGSGTAWVLLGSWALSPARPTPIHPRHECRGLSALFGDEPEKRGPGRPPKAPVSLEHAEQALEAASREHERLAQQREHVVKSIRGIGHDDHCVDL